jgi:hypothetical protein
MNKTAFILVLGLLSGCSTVMNGVAAYYDSRDPCQSNQRPNWCGASDGNVYIYSNGGRVEAIITPDSIYINQ